MTGIVNAIGRWFGRRSQEQNQEEPSHCWDRLVLVGEDGEQREFRIPAEGFLRIGRNPGNDVMLDDLLVSRWHATLWHEGGRYYLRDEESVNGTCVNGRLVRGPAVVNPGDRIEIGTGFLFLLGPEEPAPGPWHEVPHPPQEEFAPEEAGVGRNLEEYTILAELGRGGMSQVYLARCPHRSKPLAIKVPNSALLADREMLDKFWQEAEIGQSLHHPNIVQIFELRLTSTYSMTM